MGEVIDFQEEKRKRRLSNPLDYPNEGVAPLNERMIKAGQKIEAKAANGHVDWEANYHETALEEELDHNGK